VHIRLATVADIPSMMSLERQSATAGHWTEQQYRAAFSPVGAGRLVLVVEDSLASDPKTCSDRVLGFLVARHIAPEWELENIVVDLSVRRTGIGKQLLNVLLEKARATNSAVVFLEVRESNAAARTLYEHTGFEPAGRRRDYYTNPLEDAVLYRRILA
jgi:[ribosomal protein S18]-alanine N-acetyltransferase